MDDSPLKYFNSIYVMLCLLATICLSIYSFSRYNKNEDTTSIKITSFLSTKDAIYPSMSFCILPPFIEEKFQVYGDIEIKMF